MTTLRFMLTSWSFWEPDIETGMQRPGLQEWPRNLWQRLILGTMPGKSLWFLNTVAGQRTDVASDARERRRGALYGLLGELRTAAGAAVAAAIRMAVDGGWAGGRGRMGCAESDLADERDSDCGIARDLLYQSPGTRHCFEYNKVRNFGSPGKRSRTR